ncbi:hypothetical protein KM043_002671 [Ampulex compressa]|nr:hypothetical protein KM043_002671 [Ampulex compressa]
MQITSSPSAECLTRTFSSSEYSGSNPRPGLSKTPIRRITGFRLNYHRPAARGAKYRSSGFEHTSWISASNPATACEGDWFLQNGHRLPQFAPIKPPTSRDAKLHFAGAPPPVAGLCQDIFGKEARFEEFFEGSGRKMSCGEVGFEVQTGETVAEGGQRGGESGAEDRGKARS